MQMSPPTAEGLYNNVLFYHVEAKICEISSQNVNIRYELFLNYVSCPSNEERAIQSSSSLLYHSCWNFAKCYDSM